MALRWPLCDVSSRARRRGLAVVPRAGPPSRASQSLALLGMTVLIACVHTVTTYYLPDEHNPRFDTDAATRVLDQYLGVQCPERKAANKAESGGVRLTITMDTSGAATPAEVGSSR